MHKSAIPFLCLFILQSSLFCICPVLAINYNRTVKKADNCSLKFRGKERRAVKLRTFSDGNTYEVINSGKPISVTKWHTLVCKLDNDVPYRIPQDFAILNVETKKVTIESYILAAKFKSDEDNDIHAEISDSSDWNTNHIIVEVPPGDEYCIARKALWSIINNDHGVMVNDQKILDEPVRIRVTGYIFLDAKKRTEDRCNNHGGRGLRFGKHTKSRVVGLYEIHPVLELSVVKN